MDKKKKLIISCGLCLLLTLYSVYFYKNQQKLEIKRFEEAERYLKKQITTEFSKDHTQHQIIQKKIANHDLFLVVPVVADQTLLTDIELELTTLAENIVLKEGKKNALKIVVSAQPHDFHTNIKRYEYTQQVYRWNQRKEAWDQQEITTKHTTLINSLTQKTLTLGDLFTNQQNLLVLNRQIQENLIEQSNQPETDIEAILALPLLRDTHTNFSLKKSKLIIDFPKETALLQSLSLPFKDIASLINPAFLPTFAKEQQPEQTTPASKVIALTFDDGPSDTTTPAVLALLKQKKIPATFFLLGQQADKFPEIVKKIADDGHELANHSYSHPNLVTLSDADIQQQINKTQAAIFKASGVLPKYVRPPYGSYNYPTAVTIGLPIVNWSVDSLDWKSKDVTKIYNDVLTQINSDSIILMHDIHQETVDSLDKLLTKLQKDGYHFVTVTELLQKKALPLTAYYAASDERLIENK